MEAQTPQGLQVSAALDSLESSIRAAIRRHPADVREFGKMLRTISELRAAQAPQGLPDADPVADALYDEDATASASDP